MKIPNHYWQNMITADFNPLDCQNWIAVLPVAAIEQHGAHLPLATDAIIANGLIRATCAQLPAHLPVTFLPLQAVGKSDEHIGLSGTLTISWDALAQTWIDIGECAYRTGIRKLVIINSHGGNVPVMDIVARELRMKYNMLCVSTNWMRLGLPEGVFTSEERTYGIHGGEIETSMMLYLSADLVRMDKARSFASQDEKFSRQFKHLRGSGPVQFGWDIRDLNSQGVVGNAMQATSEKGQAVVNYQAQRFVELLQDVHTFDMSQLWKNI